MAKTVKSKTNTKAKARVKTKTKTKTKQKKSKYLSLGGFKISKKIAITICCIVVLIISFILFRNSDYWPFLSQSDIDQRLISVIDACMYNEDSRACKNIQKKYNMGFEYCYALSDIPQIDTLMPVYGVARKKSFVSNTINWEFRHRVLGYHPGDSQLEGDLERAEQKKDVYPYYGCMDSLEGIREQKGPNLISDPDTMALVGLSVIPNYLVSGDNISGCSAHWGEFNNLWKQIPNAQKIREEGLNIAKLYSTCNKISDARAAAEGLNSRMNSYANNYSVQMFYQKYDEWNMSDAVTCGWYDKTFKQYCGAGSDGSHKANERSSMVADFSNEMREFLHTNSFTSRIVLSD